MLRNHSLLHGNAILRPKVGQYVRGSPYRIASVIGRFRHLTPTETVCCRYRGGNSRTAIYAIRFCIYNRSGHRDRCSSQSRSGSHYFRKLIQIHDGCDELQLLRAQSDLQTIITCPGLCFTFSVVVREFVFGKFVDLTRKRITDHVFAIPPAEKINLSASVGAKWQ